MSAELSYIGVPEIPETEPPEQDGMIAVENLIGVGVPAGVRRVSKVAIDALRDSEVVISYCEADRNPYNGLPLRIQRRPQA